MLRDLILWGKEKLSFLPYAEKEVIDLFCFFLKKRKEELFFEEITNEKKRQLIWAIEERARRIPFAYITQEVQFYNCTLFINEHVLVPRPETEILVDHIIKKIPKNSTGILWDFCTGSGAIGLAIKKKNPLLHVVLVDISSDALEVAKINAKKNHVNVEFRKSNLFENFFNEQCDYFVCNPPYLSEDEYLKSEEELFFEPKISLVAPNQGLYFYQEIAKQLPRFLKKEGKGFLEIGSGQKESIIEIFSSTSYKFKVENDWAKHPRFFFLE